MENNSEYQRRQEHSHDGSVPRLLGKVATAGVEIAATTGVIVGGTEVMSRFIGGDHLSVPTSFAIAAISVVSYRIRSMRNL